MTVIKNGSQELPWQRNVATHNRYYSTPTVLSPTAANQPSPNSRSEIASPGSILEQRVLLLSNLGAFSLAAVSFTHNEMEYWGTHKTFVRSSSGPLGKFVTSTSIQTILFGCFPILIPKDFAVEAVPTFDLVVLPWPRDLFGVYFQATPFAPPMSSKLTLICDI